MPLLGGHHGGNEMARRVAEALDGHAAITTAGDNRFGVALDDPPAGWSLANPQDAKAVMARCLAGGSLRLQGNAPWLAQSALPFDAVSDDLLVAIHAKARTEPVVVNAKVKRDDGQNGLVLEFHDLSNECQEFLGKMMNNLPAVDDEDQSEADLIVSEIVERRAG